MPEQANDDELIGFLRRLADEHGKVGAAELIGINFRTLASAVDDRRVGRRLREAVERHLAQHGEGEVAPGQQAEGDSAPRLAALAASLDEFADELRQLRDAVDQLQSRLEDHVDSGLIPEPLERPASSPSTPTPRAQLAVIPEEAVADESWPEAVGRLIGEWREANVDRATAKHTLAWLSAKRWVLELELLLAGEHELTLPPADYPWSSSRRRRELRLRQADLRRTRIQLFWTRPLHWLMRAVTLGLWGR